MSESNQHVRVVVPVTLMEHVECLPPEIGAKIARIRGGPLDEEFLNALDLARLIVLKGGDNQSLS